MNTLMKTKNGESGLIDQVFDTFFDFQMPTRFAYAGTPLDLYEWEGKYVLEIPVPGFDAKDILVEVSGNTVSVTGKREEETEKKAVRYHHREMRRGSFTRSVTLPADLDPANVEATIEKGILKLVLSPVKPIAPKRIEVKTTA